MTIKTPDEIYRDYETAGVPSSGAHKPIKSDIREFLNAVVGGVLATPTIITAPGSYAVADSVALIIINLAAPGTVTLVLGAVANRGQAQLFVVDYAGTAAAIIVLTPNGTEKIGGLASWTLTSSGAGMGASAKLYPSVTLNGWAVGV